MHYVVGFQFNADGTRVALIRKGRPEWQSGLLNGIGGHVERNESAPAAMLREFEEETGMSQRSTLWREFASVRTWTGSLVAFYSSFTDAVELVRTVTDEEVKVFNVFSLPALKEQTVPNLMWLIPLALTMREDRVGGDGRESASLMVVTEMPPLFGIGRT